jgi:hypothetical protein
LRYSYRMNRRRPDTATLRQLACDVAVCNDSQQTTFDEAEEALLARVRHICGADDDEDDDETVSVARSLVRGDAFVQCTLAMRDPGIKLAERTMEAMLPTGLPSSFRALTATFARQSFLQQQQQQQHPCASPFVKMILPDDGGGAEAVKFAGRACYVAYRFMMRHIWERSKGTPVGWRGLPAAFPRMGAWLVASIENGGRPPRDWWLREMFSRARRGRVERASRWERERRPFERQPSGLRVVRRGGAVQPPPSAAGAEMVWGCGFPSLEWTWDAATTGGGEVGCW